MYPVQLEIAKTVSILIGLINPVISAPVYAYVRQDNFNAYTLLLKTKLSEWKNLKYHSLSDTNRTSAMVRVTPSIASRIGFLENLRKNFSSDGGLPLFSPKPSRAHFRVLLENSVKVLNLKRSTTKDDSDVHFVDYVRNIIYPEMEGHHL